MKKMQLKAKTAILLAAAMVMTMPGNALLAEEIIPAEVTEEDVEEIEEIWFDNNLLNISSGETKELNIWAIPEDADLSGILWSVDVPELLTVEGSGAKARVTAAATGEGIATVTACLGELTAECTVFITEKSSMISSLKFTGTSGGITNIYDLEETNPGEKLYTLFVPAANNLVYAWPTLRSGVKNAVITASYTDRYGDEVTKTLTDGKGTTLSFLLDAGAVAPTSFTIQVEADGRTEQYSVSVVRTTAMKNAVFTTANGSELEVSPAFSTDVYNYDLEIPGNLQSLQVSMEASEDVSTVFYVNDVAGEAVQELDDLTEMKLLKLSCGDGEYARPLTYTFHVTRPEMHTVEFFLARADIAIHVYDDAGVRMIPEEDGTYQLQEGKTYSCTATAKNYVTKSWNFTVTEDKVWEVKLDKISNPNQYSDVESEWSGNYKNEGNQNVASGKLPVSANETKYDWEVEAAEISNVILLDDLVCYYTADQLVLADRNQGTAVHQTALAAKGLVTMNNKPIYGGGLIYVPLVNGQIQAFDAFSLSPVWLYNNPEGGIVSGLSYSDGILYAGFYTKKGKNVLAAVDIQDENTSDRLENKTALWTHLVDSGYYQANSVVKDDVIYAVSEAGILSCLDKVSGALLQTVNLKELGGTHAGVAVSGERLYFSTTEGYVVSYPLTESGVEISGRKTIKIGGYSESTPLIVGDRLYVGCSSGAATTVNTEGSGYYYICTIQVAENGDLSLISRQSITGQISAGVVAVPGENENQVYFTVSGIRNGGFYCMVDSLTDTVSEPEYITINDGSMDRAGGEMVMGEDGRFYLHLASGKVIALSTAEMALTGIQTSVESTIDGGNFRVSMEEHLVNVSAEADSFTVSFETVGADRVLVNGVETHQCDVTLNEGKADLKVELIKGEDTRIITIHFARKNSSISLGSLMVTNSAKITDPEAYQYFPEEDLSEEVEEYHIRYCKKYYNNLFMYMDVEEGSNAKMQVRSGKNYYTATILNATTYVDHSVYYRVTIPTGETESLVWVTVTAENGVDSKTYKLYLTYDNANPEMAFQTGNLFSNRTRDGVDVTFNSTDNGRLYYLIYDKNPGGFPTPAQFLEGRVAETRVTAGENTIHLDGFSKENQYVFALVRDYGCNWASYSNPIRGYVGSAPAISMTGVALDKETMTLGMGKMDELNLELLPVGNTDDPQITWTSSNVNVASVTSSGTKAIVKATGGGDCVITATVVNGRNTYEKTCSIHVPKEVMGINLSTYRAKMLIGETMDITASLLPADAEEIPSIVWRNSNRNVISIERKGASVTLTALAEGTATLEVLCGKASIVCKVTVTDPVPKPEIHYGDANRDGKINTLDASLVRQYSVRLITEDELDMDAADVNGDGWVNALDSALIRQYSVELINIFPVEEEQ